MVLTGAELVAVLTVSISGFATIITSCFHGTSMSRCKRIDCWGVVCDREVISEDVVAREYQAQRVNQSNQQ